jgi:hypothetical protein
VFRLFFPFASPYVIMEFAYDLNYRGVPVEGAAAAAGRRNSVVLATRALAKDGALLGLGGRSVSGGSRSRPGDLVIVLPDDEASLAEASRYRERGALCFPMKPRPPMPHWLQSPATDLIGHRTIAAFRYTHKTLSDRWMDASATVWK